MWHSDNPNSVKELKKKSEKEVPAGNSIKYKKDVSQGYAKLKEILENVVKHKSEFTLADVKKPSYSNNVLYSNFWKLVKSIPGVEFSLRSELVEVESFIKELSEEQFKEIFLHQGPKGVLLCHLAASNVSTLSFLKIFTDKLGRHEPLKSQIINLRNSSGKTVLDLLFLHVLNLKKVTAEIAQDLELENRIIYYVKSGLKIDLYRRDGVKYLNAAKERNFNNLIKTIIEYQFNDFEFIFSDRVNEKIFTDLDDSVEEVYRFYSKIFYNLSTTISNNHNEVENNLFKSVSDNPVVLTLTGQRKRTLLHHAARARRLGLLVFLIAKLESLGQLKRGNQEDYCGNTLLDYLGEDILKDKRLIRDLFVSTNTSALLASEILDMNVGRFFKEKKVAFGRSLLKLRFLDEINDTKSSLVFSTLQEQIAMVVHLENDPTIISDPENKTVKHIVVPGSKSDSEIIAFIKESKLDVASLLTILDKEGRSLLHHIAQEDRRELLEFIIGKLKTPGKYSNLLNVVDVFQTTPLGYLLTQASRGGSSGDVAIILKEQQNFTSLIEKLLNAGLKTVIDADFFEQLVRLLGLGFSRKYVELILQAHRKELFSKNLTGKLCIKEHLERLKMVEDEKRGKRGIKKYSDFENFKEEVRALIRIEPTEIKKKMKGVAEECLKQINLAKEIEEMKARKDPDKVESAESAEDKKERFQEFLREIDFLRGREETEDLINEFLESLESNENGEDKGMFIDEYLKKIEKIIFADVRKKMKELIEEYLEINKYLVEGNLHKIRKEMQSFVEEKIDEIEVAKTEDKRKLFKECLEGIELVEVRKRMKDIIDEYLRRIELTEAEEKHSPTAELIVILKGLDPNIEELDLDIEEFDPNKYFKQLILKLGVVNCKDKEIIDFIKERHLDLESLLNTLDESGKSFLHHAGLTGRNQIFEFVFDELEIGNMDLGLMNKKDIYNKTPFAYLLKKETSAEPSGDAAEALKNRKYFENLVKKLLGGIGGQVKTVVDADFFDQLVVMIEREYTIETIDLILQAHQNQLLSKNSSAKYLLENYFNEVRTSVPEKREKLKELVKGLKEFRKEVPLDDVDSFIELSM